MAPAARIRFHSLLMVTVSERGKECEVPPFVVALNSPYIMTSVLEEDDDYTITIYNIRATDKSVSGAVIKINFHVCECRFMNTQDKKSLPIFDDTVCLPELLDVGLIYEKNLWNT